MDQSYAIYHRSIFRRSYEIKSQQGVIAKIRFHNLANTRAIAEINGKKWEIKNSFLGNKISLTQLSLPDSGSSASSSIINSKASYSIGGRDYYFKRTLLGKVRTEFVWTDDTANELIKFTKRGYIKLEFQVGILQPQKSLGNDDLSLLTVLGFYLIKTKYYSFGRSSSS